MLPQPAPNGFTLLLKIPVVPDPVVKAGMRPNLMRPHVFESIPTEDSRSKSGFTLPP